MQGLMNVLFQAVEKTVMESEREMEMEMNDGCGQAEMRKCVPSPFEFTPFLPIHIQRAVSMVISSHVVSTLLLLLF